MPDDDENVDSSDASDPGLQSPETRGVDPDALDNNLMSRFIESKDED